MPPFQAAAPAPDLRSVHQFRL